MLLSSGQDVHPGDNEHVEPAVSGAKNGRYPASSAANGIGTSLSGLHEQAAMLALARAAGDPADLPSPTSRRAASPCHLSFKAPCPAAKDWPTGRRCRQARQTSTTMSRRRTAGSSMSIWPPTTATPSAGGGDAPKSTASTRCVGARTDFPSWNMTPPRPGVRLSSLNNGRPIKSLTGPAHGWTGVNRVARRSSPRPPFPIRSIRLLFPTPISECTGAKKRSPCRTTCQPFAAANTKAA